MKDSKISEAEAKFIDDNRDALALASFVRADESGSQIRTILLTLTVAALGFVLQQNSRLGDHIWSAVIFAAAAAVVYVSWAMQKSKALSRAKLLRSGASGRQYLEAEHQRLPNNLLDYLAALLLFAGLIIEMLLR